MAMQQDPHRERYDQARRAFEELSIEDRVLFLVKESITTVADGIERAGRAVANEIDALFREMEEEMEEADTPAPPPTPNEPTPEPPPQKKSTSTARAKKTDSTSTDPESTMKRTATPNQDDDISTP